MRGTFANLKGHLFTYKNIVFLSAAMGMLVVGFQNCSPQAFKAAEANLSSSSTDAGTAFCDSNPTLPECAEQAPAVCSFNGVTLNNGETVVAYRNSTVAAGKTCKSETRKCNNGTLSGSFRYPSCTVNAPSACSFDGKSVAHGDAVKAYLKSAVPFAESCTEEERACNNGSLSGSFQYSSCKVGDPVSCLFDGKTILHGESVTAYPASSVAFGETCTPATRTCYNGALSNSGDFASCTVNAPASCLFDSKTIAHEEKVTAYEKSAVAYGETCTPVERTCSNGTLSGVGDFGSCVVDQPDSCLVNGVTVPHDGNITLYFANKATATEACNTEVRTCHNGLLSGSAAFSSCEPLPPEPCTFDGKPVASGSSVTAYSVSSVAFGTTCPTATSRTCTNGVLSGTGDFPSCTVEKAANCTFNGKAVNHGSSVSAYEKNTVPFGSTCQVSTRTCTNGVLSGSGDFTTCKVAAAVPCDFNGTSIAHSKSVKAYSVSSVPFGSSCPAAITRTCNNGVLSESGDFKSCSVTAAASCTFNGSTIAHSRSVTTYPSTSVPYGQSCTATTRTCNNGVLSGSGDITTCTVQAAASCTLDGQTIDHGTYKYAYQSKSVPYGQRCSYSTRTCTNGVLSGTGDYLSCSVEKGASCNFKGALVADGATLKLYEAEFVSPGSECSEFQAQCTNGALWTSDGAGAFGTYFYDIKNASTTCTNSEFRSPVKRTYSADGYLWTEIKLPTTLNDREGIIAPYAISDDGSRVLATMTGAIWGNWMLTSNDGGLNWKAVSQVKMTNMAVLQSSRDGNTILAFGQLNNSAKSQFLISKNFGTAWSAPTLFKDKKVVGAAVSKDGTYIIAAIDDGNVMLSKDAGETWTSKKMFSDPTPPPPSSPDVTPLPTTPDPSFVKNVNMAITPDGKHIFIAAGLSSSVSNHFISHDSGMTWISGTAFDGAYYQSPFKVTISDDGKVIAMGSIYSTNFGNNWAVYSEGVSGSLFTTADGQTLTQTGKWFVVVSNNMGASWKELNKQYNLGARNWVGVGGSANGNYIIAMGRNTDLGIGYGVKQNILLKAVKSTEAKPYTATGENFKQSASFTKDTYSIALSKDGRWIYTGSSGIAWSQYPSVQYEGGSCSYSPDRDVSWGSLWLIAPQHSYNTPNVPGIYCDFKVSSDAKTVLTKTDGGVYISRNNFVSWEYKSFPKISSNPLIADVYTDVFMSADGNKIFISGLRNYVSNDSGTSWKEVPTWSNSTDANKPSSVNLKGLAGSADGKILYAYPSSTPYYSLIKSTDGGASWAPLKLPFYTTLQTPSSMNCSSGQPSTNCKLFMTGNIDVSMNGDQVTVVDSNGQIQLSLDGGKTWSTLQMPDYKAAIKVSTSENGQIIAAITEFGFLYISKDRGASWVEQTRAGLQYWSSIKVSADGTFVAAGSQQLMPAPNNYNSLMTAPISPPSVTVPLYLEPNPNP